MQKITFQNLHRIRYKEAWDYQEQLFEAAIRAKLNKEEDRKQHLLFCEHEPVYTLGKSGNAQNLLIAENICHEKNIDYFPIDRGGDITFHGHGQLVVYPIIDLELFNIGIKKYISMLEDVVIEVLKSYDIVGEKDEKAMGVWIDAQHPMKARKICAIGVRTSRHVTMHGLALNVNTDLSYFSYINPCGFTDKAVTSMAKELDKEVDFAEVEERMKRAFCEVFGCILSTQTPVSSVFQSTPAVVVD
ncbi:MAG: lipoyl(octanoyl) transferase LipB [Dysgonamonadaceae bacterium]|jgi:lipoyl(octanoyl) transferase|nr:lipoyl(octanoyl) transferase LipB [Dysgonamonadaceae bacterium]